MNWIEVHIDTQPAELDGLCARLEELGMARLYETVDFPLCAVLAEMEDVGFLIDRGALTRLQVGRPQVSETHAGFATNRGGATAADVVALMRQVRKTVQEREGVLLEPEIRLLGSFEEGM